MEPEDQADEQTPAEKLIASRLRSGQFRLSTAFGLTLLAGVFMAIPRFTGVSYSWYFNFLYMSLYGCAPLSSWLTYATLPKRFGAWKLVASSLVFVGLVVPFWVLFAWQEALFDLIMLIAVTCIIFWLPQIICIWMVWFFVFRSSSRRR